jgi:hypothetical protein
MDVQQNASGGKGPDRRVFRTSKRGRGEMIKAPTSLQELRRRIYRKTKSAKSHRFWGLFVHITKMETLKESYRALLREIMEPPVSIVKTSQTSKHRDSTHFLRTCGKNS